MYERLVKQFVAVTWRPSFGCGKAWARQGGGERVRCGWVGREGGERITYGSESFVSVCFHAEEAWFNFLVAG